MAWLRSTPKGAAESRFAMVTGRGEPISMPDLLGFDRLAEHIEDFGPFGYGSSGIIPVTFQELESWSRMTGNALTCWQAEVLIRASKAYCHQSHKSDNPLTPPPYSVAKTEHDMAMIRKRADSKIRSIF